MNGFPITTMLNCGSQPPPQCPPVKANIRWHYMYNGTSGSWSGTYGTPCPGSLTTHQQAMEGDLKVTPGDTLYAGYDFNVPGNNSSFTLTFNNPMVVFTVNCADGSTPSSSTLTVSMPTQSYAVTNSNWYPSGDQHSPLVYQGSVIVPDLCDGAKLRLNQGGVFSTSLS